MLKTEQTQGESFKMRLLHSNVHSCSRSSRRDANDVQKTLGGLEERLSVLEQRALERFEKKLSGFEALEELEKRVSILEQKICELIP